METHRNPGFIAPVGQRNTCLGTQRWLRPFGEDFTSALLLRIPPVNAAGSGDEQHRGLLSQSLFRTGVYLGWLCLLLVVLVIGRDRFTSDTYLFLVKQRGLTVTLSTLRSY